MYDFSAEPGNNELTVNEGEIITITNPVRELLCLNWSLKDLCLRFYFFNRLIFQTLMNSFPVALHTSAHSSFFPKRADIWVDRWWQRQGSVRLPVGPPKASRPPAGEMPDRGGHSGLLCPSTMLGDAGPWVSPGQENHPAGLWIPKEQQQTV